MFKKLLAGSLMAKLVAFLLVISAAQILIIGFLSFQSAKTGLEQAALDKLDAERELRKNELLAYFQDTLQNLKFMAQTSNARSAIETLQSYHLTIRPLRIRLLMRVPSCINRCSRRLALSSKASLKLTRRSFPDTKTCILSAQRINS